MSARIFFLLALLVGFAGFMSPPVAHADDGAQASAHDHPSEGEGGEHAAGEHAAGDHEAGDHAAGDHEDGHHGDEAEAPNPLAADVDLAIWTLIIFVCLLAVLKKVAWGPITQALEAREAGISDSIAAAAAKHEEAKKLLAEHQAKIDKAADEVREMLEEARRDAEATKSQIVADAHAAAEADRQRALRDIEMAKDSAVKSLAEQSASLAVDLAGKVVKQEISQERQSEIVREALGLMGSGDASNN